MGHTIYVNDNDVHVPSVTTILNVINKPKLLTWANVSGLKGNRIDHIKEQAVTVGTWVHTIIDGFLNGTVVDKSKIPNRYLNDILYSVDLYLTWYKSNTITKIDTELKITSEEYGGTLDFYGIVNDKYTILDYKTSTRIYMDMFFQLAGYVQLIEYIGKPVDQVGIILIPKKGKLDTKFMRRDELEPFIKVFNSALQLYNAIYDVDERMLI